MAKPKSNVLEEGREGSITLQEGEYYSWDIKNPNGARVICKVISGAGLISLSKNGRMAGSPYTISTDPGYPTNVSLRTLTIVEEKKLKGIAHASGVDEKDIVKHNKKGPKTPKKLYIPASDWTLYIEAFGPGNNKFKVELVYPYAIKNGDTLFSIATKYGLTVKKLLALNPDIKNPNYIYVGQLIRVS